MCVMWVCNWLFTGVNLVSLSVMDVTRWKVAGGDPEAQKLTQSKKRAKRERNQRYRQKTTVVSITAEDAGEIRRIGEEEGLSDKEVVALLISKWVPYVFAFHGFHASSPCPMAMRMAYVHYSVHAGQESGTLALWTACRISVWVLTRHCYEAVS